MLNKIPLIFLVLGIIAVLAVSGCTIPGFGPGPAAAVGYGLVISDFYTSMDEVTGCDRSVRVDIGIENKGGYIISTGDVLACLMGSNFPGITSDQMWAASVTGGKCICQPSAKKLGAASPAENIPGDTATFSWNLKSPFINHPLTRSDTFTGRVFYKYGSRASTTVWVYNEDELTAAKQRGETIPSGLTVEKTMSPVDISVDTIQPVVGENGDTFTLKVTVSNTGGGTVFNESSTTMSWSKSNSVPSIPADDLNLISVSVSVPSGKLGATGTGFCGNELQNIELRKGATVTIPCDINITETIGTKKSYPITLTASYGYYLESSASIATIGKKDQTSTECTELTSDCV